MRLLHRALHDCCTHLCSDRGKAALGGDDLDENFELSDEAGEDASGGSGDEGAGEGSDNDDAVDGPLQRRQKRRAAGDHELQASFRCVMKWQALSYGKRPCHASDVAMDLLSWNHNGFACHPTETLHVIIRRKPYLLRVVRSPGSLFGSRKPMRRARDRLATAELLKRHGVKPSKQSAAELEAAEGGSGSADDAQDGPERGSGSEADSADDESELEDGRSGLGDDAGDEAAEQSADVADDDEDDGGSDGSADGIQADGSGSRERVAERLLDDAPEAEPSEQAAAAGAARRSEVSSLAPDPWSMCSYGPLLPALVTRRQVVHAALHCTSTTMCTCVLNS